MTREEALRLLGLEPGADAAAVRAAGERKTTELARLRAKASTPEARASYEAQMAALRKAYQALVGGRRAGAVASPLSASQERDLPLRAPRATVAPSTRTTPPEAAGRHDTPAGA